MLASWQYNDNGLEAGSGDYLSVHPSVCHTPLLYQNGWTCVHANNAIRYPINCSFPMPKTSAKCQQNYPQWGRQIEVQIGNFRLLSRYILTRSSAIAHGLRYVTKFVLCFTRYGSYTGFKQQSDLQGYLRALAMVLFDRPHTISYNSHPLQ